MPSVADFPSRMLIGAGVASGEMTTQPVRNIAPIDWQTSGSDLTPVYRHSQRGPTIVGPGDHPPELVAVEEEDWQRTNTTRPVRLYSSILGELLTTISESLLNYYRHPTLLERTRALAAIQESAQSEPTRIYERLAQGFQDDIMFVPRDLEKMKTLLNRYVVHLTANPQTNVRSSASSENQSKHLRDIAWVKDATGFSVERIAALLGVSRRTLYDWREGKAPEDSNRIRVFQTREILERAQEHFSTREQLSSWLLTPDSVYGISPEAYLRKGELDHVRGLALMGPTGVEWIGERPGGSPAGEWKCVIEGPM